MQIEFRDSTLTRQMMREKDKQIRSNIKLWWSERLKDSCKGKGLGDAISRAVISNIINVIERRPVVMLAMGSSGVCIGRRGQAMGLTFGSLTLDCHVFDERI